MTTKINDPFLQRAVEHWLDNANELSYQPFFGEWLLSIGHKLKYIIKNTHFEQGKDVVSVDTDGIPHGFQLKGGDISLKRWRSEVKPEIEALIEIPIKHPDIKLDISHKSWLVTNGEIADNAREDILGLNQGKWKDNPLNIITRGDLISYFHSITTGILPSNVYEYKILIELIFENGEGLPDVSKIEKFISDILKINSEKKIGFAERKRDIASAVLYTMMILGPYRIKNNYGSIIRILSILISKIFYVVDVNNLKDEYWLSSYQIIWNDLVLNCELLEREIFDVGFERSFTDVLGTELISFRKHSVASLIFSFKVSQVIVDKEFILEDNYFDTFNESLILWGEASLLPFIYQYLVSKETGYIKNILITIINNNGRKSSAPGDLVPPYLDLDFAVNRFSQLLDFDYIEKHKLSSYYMKVAIEILVRNDERKFLESIWKDLTFFHLEEFIADNVNDLYRNSIESGVNMSEMLQEQKSWKDLVEESSLENERDLPKSLLRFPEFIPFFLIVFPHRVSTKTIGYLCKKINE